MKKFRAVYECAQTGREYELDLLANSLTRAMLSAEELIPRETVLKSVFHYPDWS